MGKFLARRLEKLKLISNEESKAAHRKQEEATSDKWEELINGEAGKLTRAEWEELTKAMIEAIKSTPKAPNKWIGKDNKEMADGEEVLLSTIQAYISDMFNTGDDDLLENVQRIFTEVLKYYPQRIESLCNLGSIHLINKEAQEGLKVLFKVNKLSPKAHIILFNIARRYVLKGDKKEAIKYYKEAIKHGEQRTRTQAEKQIRELTQ